MESVAVVGGVDTHGAIHHAAVLDMIGRRLGDREFPASESGYASMLGWMKTFGTLETVGIEGTGSYGAGLARHLHRADVAIVEVPRPDRRTRRQVGKSDPIDAEVAARAVLAGTKTTSPKLATGAVESIRMLRVARTGAVKAKTAAINTLRAIVITSPEPLRSQLRGMSRVGLVNTCRRLRPELDSLSEPLQAAKATLHTVAERAFVLAAEAEQLEQQMARVLAVAAPATTRVFGLGTDTAAALIASVGDNPDRLRSEAALARMAGVAPIPASSGQTKRHRLHRGGDRSANQALHVAVIVRLRYCKRTQAYAARRRAEGLSSLEIIRCLKRYLAREVFGALRSDFLALSA